MRSSLLSSDESRIKTNLQHSRLCASSLVNQTHYSRHLPSRHESRSSSGKPSRVIHASIRSPKQKRRQVENQFEHHSALELRSMSSDLRSIDHHDYVENSDVIRNIASEPRKATHPLRSNVTPQFRRLLSQSSQSSYPHEDKRDTVLQKNHSSSAKVFTKQNSAIFTNNNDNTVNWSTNTNNLLEKSGKRNKTNRSNGHGCRCKCVLIFVIMALLACAAIIAALVTTLTKSDTTTTTTTTVETSSETTTAAMAINETTSTTDTSTDSTTSTTLMTTSSTTTTATSTITTSIVTTSTTVTISTSTTTISTTQTTTATVTSTTTTSVTTALNMAYGSPSSSVNNYGGTETVRLNCSTTLKNFTLQIFVQRTYGATYNAAYGNSWGGTVNIAYTTNSSHIIYTWSIVSGQVITCSGGPYVFTAQFTSNGTAQVTSGDTYIMTTTTSSGITNTFSGYF